MEPRLASVGSLILVLCVATTLLAGVADPSNQGEHTATELGQAALQETDEAKQAGEPPAITPDSVHLRVAVHENGTAQWQIEYRTQLEDEETEAAFQQLHRDRQQESAAENEAFYDRIRASIASAENATGREMAGSEFETTTTVRQLPQPYGVVVYSFQWHGFATTSGDQITAGDALEGFFLNDDEQLSISAPDGYELTGVQPGPDGQQDGTVTWAGPASFGPGEPRVVATEAAGPVTPALVLGTAAVLLGVTAVLVWLRRRRGAVLPQPTVELANHEDDGQELLSNEEQVVDLLEQRGGRVKQKEVADELDWTKTKTSYVVSNLRDEGRIHSFRLGRENVLSLSEPDDPGSGRA